MDATGGGRAQVWDVVTGRAVSRVLEHEIWLTHIEFSPDGSRVLTASGDGTARVWEAATGEPLTSPLRHPGEVRHAGFRADGRQIFTLCHRGPRDSPFAPNGLEVRVWDARTGQQLTPTLMSYPYIQMDRSGDPHRYFARDGHRVLLVRADQSLEVRDFSADPRPVDELRADAEVLSGRGISSGGSAQPVGDERYQASWQPILGPPPAPDRLAWHREQAEAGLAPAPAEPPADITPRDPAAALWHAGRLLEANPADGKARRWHARAALALGLWNIAVTDFENILAGGRDDAPYYDLGVARAQLGKWPEAAEAFELASQTPNASLESLSALARVRLFRGDDKGYREVCALMLDRLAREAVSVEVSSRALRTCAVGPLPADDTQRLVALMEMKYAVGAGWFGGRPGVYYRAGRYREAAELLQDSLTGEGANEVRTWFFLAMTQQCQHQQKEAEQTLARGMQRWKQRAQERGQGEPAAMLRTWQERLDEELLRREAERLVTPNR
jgi:tetratricopeptide (TPR) repeat protein